MKIEFCRIPPNRKDPKIVIELFSYECLLHLFSIEESKIYECYPCRKKGSSSMNILENSIDFSLK